MAFTDFAEHDWTTGDTITAALLDALEKRAAGARPYLQIKKTANVTLVADTKTVLTFDTETYDNDGMFTATGSDITIQLTGVYHVLFTAAFVINGTPGVGDHTNLDIIDWQDPTAYPLASTSSGNVGSIGAGVEWWQQVSYVGRLTVGDILNLRAESVGFIADIKNNAGGASGDSIWATVTMLARDPAAT